MKQNLLVFLAEMYNVLEIHPAKCVRYPGEDLAQQYLDGEFTIWQSRADTLVECEYILFFLVLAGCERSVVACSHDIQYYYTYTLNIF